MAAILSGVDGSSAVTMVRSLLGSRTSAPPSLSRHWLAASTTVNPSGKRGVTSRARNRDHAASLTPSRPPILRPNINSICCMACCGAPQAASAAAAAAATPPVRSSPSTTVTRRRCALSMRRPCSIDSYPLPTFPRMAGQPRTRRGLHLSPLAGRGQVRGPLRESEPVERPLTPTLSPQAGRGSGGAAPYAIALPQADHSGQRLADLLGHFLGVAQEHHRVIAIEQRVVDAGIARRERTLVEHHGAGLPHMQHRHAVDRRFGVVLGG